MKSQAAAEKSYNLFHLLKTIGIPWSSFLVPSVFSLLSGLAEGLNLLLLLPLCRGLVGGNYGFLKSEPWFQKVTAFFHVSNLSNTVIFSGLLVTVFISAITKCLLEYFSVLLVSQEIRKFMNNLRKLLFGRFISFGKLYFDQNNLGVIHQNLIASTSRIGYDLQVYQQSLTMIIQLIIYLGAMFWISWQLSLAALLIFPLLHYSSNWLIYKIKTSSTNYAGAMDDLSKKVFNVFSAIVLVKSYHAEEREKRSFGLSSDSVARHEFSIDKKSNLILPLQEIVFFLVMLFLVSTIALLVHYRAISEFSSFLVFFYILKRSSSHFKSLNTIRSSYASSLGLWKNVMSVMNDDNKFFVLGGARKFSGLENKISIKKLNFSFPLRPAVLNVCSFEIQKGRMTALVGETGAGKSTIVNLLCRFYEAPRASIFIDGIDINDFSLESFYERVAYVSQDVQLMNDTLRANLLYGIDSKDVPIEKIGEVLTRARLGSFVEKLQEGLDTMVGDRGVRLSGGEKQRLSIARAILKDTPILILDEATSSLDTHTETLIQESIMEAAKGRTTIVIAHRLSTIKNADKIIVLDQGRVSESGSLKELLDKKGKFYELWEMQRFG